MRKLIIVVCSLMLASLAQAQNSTATSPTQYLAEKEDQMILVITSDNWDKLPSYIKAKPIRSRGFNMLFMAETMKSTASIGLGYGIGFSSQNVHTDGIIVDTINNGLNSTLVPIPDSLGYELNKLSLNFLTGALEFRIRTAENEAGHRFKVSLGILGGLLLQSHTKYEDKDGKVKGYNVQHLNKFQFGATARLGYGKFTLFGYYSFVDVFKEGRGIELTPYSIGLGLAL